MKKKSLYVQQTINNVKAKKKQTTKNWQNRWKPMQIVGTLNKVLSKFKLKRFHKPLNITNMHKKP